MKKLILLLLFIPFINYCQKFYDNPLEHLKDIIVTQSLLAENRFEDLDNYLNKNGFVNTDENLYTKYSDYKNENNVRMSFRISSHGSNNMVINNSPVYHDNYLIVTLVVSEKISLNEFRNKVTIPFLNSMPLGFPKKFVESAYDQLKELIKDCDDCEIDYSNKNLLKYSNGTKEQVFNVSNFFSTPDWYGEDEKKSFIRDPISYLGMGKNDGLLFEFKLEQKLNDGGVLIILVRSNKMIEKNDKKIDFNYEMFDAIEGINDVIWQESY